MPATFDLRGVTRVWPALACAALGAAGVACAPRPASDPTLLGRLGSAQKLSIAYELVPACKLEALPGELSPSTSAWRPVAPNELAGTQLTVTERQASRDDRGAVRTLKVVDASGRARWLRNTPAALPAEVEDRWSCVVDADLIAPRVKAVSATTVRLVPNAPSCVGFTPLLGDAGDVTFDPYTVLGRRLLRTASGLVAVVTLASKDGERALSVSASDLDSCFAVTNRAPLAAKEHDSVATWLGDVSAAPPSAALGSYLQTAGLDPAACLSEGSGATRHDECRAAPFGVASVARPDGTFELRFSRERVADAVHAYGGTLAPAEELAGINVLMRQVRGSDDGFGNAFGKALLTSLVDTPRQTTRAARGYRLVRAADVAAGTTANVNLDIEVTFAMPKVVTSSQVRRQRKVRGKAPAPNPAFGTAARQLATAKASLDRAESEAVVYQALYGAAQAPCTAGLPVACDLAATKDFAPTRARLEKRRARVGALERSASALPPTIDQDDVVAVDYRANIHRRRGEATVTFKLTATPAFPDMPPLQINRKLSFDASEVEVLADPAKGVEGKAARPPEAPQVDAAIAETVLAEADRLLSLWMRRATAKVPPAAFEPGSRAELALLARYTAANRQVKLVSDFTENRVELLAGKPIEYPIAFPPGTGRCYALVATPATGSADVNLALRTSDGGALVARDMRHAPDAGFEVCPPPGRYVLSLSAPAGAAAGPIAVGLFESTPGVAADADPGAVMPPARSANQPRVDSAPAASSVPRIK
jgi:hypothetical protein